MTDSKASLADSEDDDDSSVGVGEKVTSPKKSKPDKSMLFGDDDSSSDDKDDDDDEVDNNEKKKIQPEEVKESKTQDANITDTDDDSEDDSKAQNTAVEKKSSRTGLSDDDDDDNDSDDAEFDDAGAKIVGLNSSTVAGANAIESASMRMKALRNSDDEIDMEDDSKFVPKEEIPDKPVVVLNRPMTVLEVNHRPDPNQHKLFMTKLPNILGIQPECFDPSTYSARTEDDEFGQASFNLIRWRYKMENGEYVRDEKTNELVRESNARIVEWDDGSYTLHIGNESFQVDMTNTNDAKTGFAGTNGYLYLSQTATYGSLPKVSDESDDAEVQAEETAGTVLECMGAITSRLLVRPSSLQSEAHKSLTVGIRQKTIKKARIAEIVTQEDPEKLKRERIKVKEDFDRAESRKRGSSRSYGDTGNGGGGNRRPRARMARSYLEDDEGNYDTMNIGAMKRKTYEDDDFIDDDIDDMDGYNVQDNDNDDDDDDEDQTFHRVRPGRGNKLKQQQQLRNKQKAVKDDDDDEDDEDMGKGGDDDDDDDDDAVMMNKNRNTKKRSNAVLDDDESD